MECFGGRFRRGTTACTAATDQRRNRVSDALLLTANKLNVGNEFFFTEFQLCALAASLDHLDVVHDIKTDAELASAVDTILCPAVPPSLLVRATLFVISVLTHWLDLSTMTDSLVHMNSENLDLLAGAEMVLDLASIGPGLLESCRRLMKLRTAFAIHDTGGSVDDMDNGDDGVDER
ncbi:hypothetical protein VOLCADRAFT_87945 [Volvox carteri f. nagariensis]|uniref:Uncharacterized protein n=1 Tax=Volvox carteri f. nagariensis TaxID=3068 RepID=D8TMN3_VOLCA|nr:uncharacterized protein VOLCADRAFT_87945 [Volvox carteri f. nagariensis]EFJ51154.1 hypothetical protein VOLCADRAFT_87945 [Volvox carteri f. nagariensis]|eukprot:XP_002947621.1 hypothetical protein VOLCADRAFT_87945 [Volvox carteri f. nagariensis]